LGLQPAVKTSKLKGKPTSVALLPHVQMTYGQLRRMLAKHNIKCVGLLPRKISSLLHPMKRGWRRFTAYPESVVGCTLERLSDLYRPEKRAPLAQMAWTSRQIDGGRI
jgi:hypothetical protein